MNLTVISLDTFLRCSPGSLSVEAKEECRKVAQSLIETGALIVSDSRVGSGEANDRFINLFEDYFNQSEDVLRKDERPEVGYQVGVTLENTEKPRCGSDEECLGIISKLHVEERPIDLTGHGADPKCRFFHKMAQSPPYQSRFPLSEIENVTPEGFDQWEERVNEWGGYMKQSVEGVVRMLAIGLGLPENQILDAGKYGSHLLAPTATNLQKYGQLNTIFAGFHSDLNFLTIHGQSRYPGLHIWARNSGKRLSVKIPPGCLLVQAGKQLEWMTGGLVKAGYHEVVCTQSTLDTMERRKVEYPERPLIRISSTFFWHLSPDYLLHPIPQLQPEAIEKFGEQKDYGEMYVGDQVRRELGLIALMPNSHSS